MDQETKRVYADDATEGVNLLIHLRLPWLVGGLLGGLFASLVTSRFETVLTENISLAFFIPLIVYMSDAVGTQTETIYVRNLAKKKAPFGIYLIKELMVGVTIGAILGIIIGFVANLWLHDSKVAWTVGLAMFGTVATAPLIALVVAAFMYREHTDPAVGAGPLTTVIQDNVSLLIYFAIASVILLR